MSTSVTVLHVRGHGPDEIEQALDTVFTREERPRVLRLEGTYSAVLARATDSDLEAAYRYIVLRPHDPSPWTPILELGNRTVGLDVELSRLLDGADVFTAFVYDDGFSGYACVRRGEVVDRYVSDPTYFSDADEPGDDAAGAANGTLPPAENVAADRGHPERFADLLPEGTSPQDFWNVVLRPGYWEEHDETGAQVAPGQDEEELVDEEDRMRCIGLALELWGPSEYPFAQPPEEIPNAVAGPALALAYR